MFARALIVIAALVLSFSSHAFAQQTAGGGRLQVDITEGHLNPMPIAAPLESRAII